MHFVVYCRRLPPHTHWERLEVCSQQPSWYLPAIHLPEGRSLCSRQAAWDPRQVRLLVPQTGGCCWCLPAPPQRREKQFLWQPVAPTVKLEPSPPVAKISSRGSILLTSAVWTAVSCCLCDTWARPLTKKPLKTHLIQFFFYTVRQLCSRSLPWTVRPCCTCRRAEPSLTSCEQSLF